MVIYVVSAGIPFLLINLQTGVPVVPYLARSLLLLKKKVHSVVKRPRKRVPGLASTGILFVPVNLHTGVLLEKTTMPCWLRAFSI